MTDEAAIGYMIMAVKKAGKATGLDHEKVLLLISAMKKQMGVHTEKEAQWEYRDFVAIVSIAEYLGIEWKEA